MSADDQANEKQIVTFWNVLSAQPNLLASGMVKALSFPANTSVAAANSHKMSTTCQEIAIFLSFFKRLSSI